MNKRSQLRRTATQRTDGAAIAGRSARQRGPFPAPDPATRVAFGRVSASPQARPHGGGSSWLPVLGAILLSVCSKFVRLIDLPSLSEVSVAALGGALAALGVYMHRFATIRGQCSSGGGRHVGPRRGGPAVVDRAAEHASDRLAAGTRSRVPQRTWIEVVLPAAGYEPADPALARDLLAAAALDAGGDFAPSVAERSPRSTHGTRSWRPHRADRATPCRAPSSAANSRTGGSAPEAVRSVVLASFDMLTTAANLVRQTAS